MCEIMKAAKLAELKKNLAELNNNTLLYIV